MAVLDDLAAAVQDEADRRQPVLISRILLSCQAVRLITLRYHNSETWCFHCGEEYVARILASHGDRLDLSLDHMLTMSRRWEGPVQVRLVPACCFEVRE